KVLFNTQVDEITGNGTAVTGIKLTNTATKKTETMPIDGVFLAIGHKPNSQLLKGVVHLDDQGYIQLADRSQKTAIKGLFAAGDVADHVYRQAGVAAGDGIKAAMDAIFFLQEIGFTQKVAESLDKLYYEPHPEIAGTPLPKIKTVADFEQASKKQDFMVI